MFVKLINRPAVLMPTKRMELDAAQHNPVFYSGLGWGQAVLLFVIKKEKENERGRRNRINILLLIGCFEFKTKYFLA